MDQLYENIEHIIIEGKSTDRKLEIVIKYRGKTSKIISEKDEGIYDAMNKDVQIATGDIIYFPNSDYRLSDENVISNVMKKFEKNDKISLLYSDVISEVGASEYEILDKY